MNILWQKSFQKKTCVTWYIYTREVNIPSNKITASSYIYTFGFNIKYSLLKLLCTLARLYEGTSLQPLRLDFFGSPFPCILAQIFHFSFLQEGKYNKGKGTQIPWEHSAPQPAHPINIVPCPISHLSTDKVSSTPRCAIPRHHTPLPLPLPPPIPSSSILVPIPPPLYTRQRPELTIVIF